MWSVDGQESSLELSAEIDRYHEDYEVFAICDDSQHEAEQENNEEASLCMCHPTLDVLCARTTHL